MLTKLLFLTGLAFSVSLPIETEKVTNGLVSKIIEALSSKQLEENTYRLRDYLSMSATEINEKLKTFDENGNNVRYTLFAPESWAFSRVIPQDIGDPFFNDENLRLKVMLRHITQESVTNNLTNSITLKMMVDSASLTRDENGKQFINEAEIISEAIPIPGGLGFVYLVDRVFVSHDEISDSISRFPSASIGFLSGTTEVAPTVDEPDIIEELSTESISKGSTIKGGYTKQDPKDAAVLEMAKFAASVIVQSRNTGKSFDLMEVTSAESQVVAGRNFKLKISLGNTLENVICDVVVFDQPWTQRRELSSFDCH